MFLEGQSEMTIQAPVQVLYKTFLGEVRDCNTDWGIGTPSSILLPYSDLAITCFQQPYSCIAHTRARERTQSVTDHFISYYIILY
jgi:hypothetical protein